MDRRGFLVSGAATAAHALMMPAKGLTIEASAFEMALDGALPELPAGLLHGTFAVPNVARALLAPGAWRPYPKAADRAGWEAVPQDVRTALAARAETANTGEWPSLLASVDLQFKRTGSRAEYERVQFARRVRIADLVMGECISHSGKYLDQIVNGVWLVCEESFWGASAHLGAQKAGVGLADVREPIVDLFAAETAATMAWVAYLLETELAGVSPLVVPRIRMEAKRRVLDPAMQRNDFGWMGLDGKTRRLNNWTPWINSNWLTAVLLLETDAEVRARAVEKSCRSVDRFLADYSPDGGCEEGPNYWQRSAGSYFDCCWTLVSAHGGAGKAVLSHPFVRAMGRYICDVHIAKRQYVDYGDAHVTDAPAADLMYRYGKASGETVLEEFGAFDAATRGLAGSMDTIQQTLGEVTGLGSLSRGLAAVMCAAEIRNATRKDALPRDAWYPKLGLMTARQKEGAADGFYVALQAANNGRSHGHNDSGSFLVYHDGAPVFIDVGVGVYEAKTFSAQRYTIWTMQSAFHNLPTIGGVMQHEGIPYQASEAQYATDDASAHVRVNLAAAYPKEAGVQRWMRTIALDRSKSMVRLQEEFALAKEAPVVLSFMTSRVPAVQEGGVLLHAEGQRDVMLAFDGAQVKASVEKIALTDATLKHSWGAEIYRVLVASAGPVAKGNWEFAVRVA